MHCIIMVALDTMLERNSSGNSVFILNGEPFHEHLFKPSCRLRRLAWFCVWWGGGHGPPPHHTQNQASRRRR